MKFIGQPESYSDMLERVFATTLATGLACTVMLAQASPAFRSFLNSLSTTADVGPLKGVRALYVLVPLVLAVASRAIRLHDKISDVFRLRYRFDIQHILFPMAERAGLTLTDELKNRLSASRNAAMYKVFYPYASFADPVIDRQLVRTAADNWSWLWVALEAAFVSLVTLLILALLKQWSYVTRLGTAIVVLLVFAIFQWLACRRAATRQVEAIVEDLNRKQAIVDYFRSVGFSDPTVGGGRVREVGEAGTSPESLAATGGTHEWDAFICHAGEDKADVVEPLAKELQALGLKIWYDRWVLRIGDSLRRKIDDGLAKSRYSIVVLSPDFFLKDWPQHELDGLVQREIGGRKVILPVWHNVARADVLQYSVTLADKLAGSTHTGIAALAKELAAVIRS